MLKEGAGRVLVVEDERNVGSTLVERLGREGFDVTWTTNVADSRKCISTQSWDLVLMDVGLPDGSGFTLAEYLRETQRSAALIFLTAAGNPEDRVHGLELGAEDYVVKPFHLKELLLRIQRVLRRAQHLTGLSGTTSESVQVGRALIHFPKFSAEVDGKQVPLTHKECALLKLLLDRKGQVVSRDEILDGVWSENEFPSPRTVDNFVMRLRRLVENNADNPQLIRSVRGVGYILED